MPSTSSTPTSTAALPVGAVIVAHFFDIDPVARISISERLEEMPDTVLRGLYESLDLAITYAPGENAVDIEITLADQTDVSGLATQDCSVPPVGFEPTLSEV